METALFGEDVLKILREKVRGVEWARSTGPESMIVVVDQIRNNEKILPERSQTISYDNIKPLPTLTHHLPTLRRKTVISDLNFLWRAPLAPLIFIKSMSQRSTTSC